MSDSTSAAASISGGLLEAISCDVCSEVYERTKRTPLVLPCGHTFCRACLTEIKKTGQFLCPTCRVQHNNVRVKSLTVNFTLLNVLPFCNDLMHDKCDTHGDDLRYWCCTCDLPLCSLCLYSGHPQGHIIKLVKAFVEDKKLELTEKIKLFFANIESQKNELKGCFNNLDADMKKLFHKNAYIEDKLTALSDLLDETQEASDIASVKYYENAVKNFQCEEKDKPSSTEDPKEEKAKYEKKDEPSGTDIPEEEKAKNQKGAEASKKCTEQYKEQKPSGQLSQNQKTTKSHCATIHFREGCLLLYSVASPASKGLCFQVPSEVFLELSVGDRYLGRVFINLWCHMRLAQQMITLCMGTMNLSLLNIKASQIIGKFLVFNNVAGNQPLITNLEWGGQYSKPEVDGYVAAVNQYGQFNSETYGQSIVNSASFAICTKSTVNATVYAPFGRVVKGLEVVEAAFQHNPVTEVTITNSGLVLPGLSL